MSRRIRVLHCPELIGGNPSSLANAERKLGLDSRAVALQPHPFGYGADLFLTRGGVIAVQAARWKLLWMALRESDVVHFNFGQSILPYRLPLDIASRTPVVLRRLYNLYAGAFELRDLRWLKHSGKGIVVTYQGDDARRAQYLREHFEISPANAVSYYSKQSDQLKQERVREFSKWADAIFALNPDLLHVLPANARFLPYAHFDVRAVLPVPTDPGRTPVVLHAPSHRGVKGTEHLLDAVARLKSENVSFEFVLVEGVRHDEALRMYARADLLVDQLLVGWYGGLAVELMAAGKPVVAYLREGDLKYLPSDMRLELPVITATPGSIYAVLKEWLTRRRSQLPAVGMASRAYAEKWHDPVTVAAQTRRVYQDIVVHPDGPEAG